MNDLVRTRLDNKTLRTPELRRQYFREILQEIALYSLSVHGFFEKAFFHGGTELRLLHSLPRFSEDLDFPVPHELPIIYNSTLHLTLPAKNMEN